MASIEFSLQRVVFLVDGNCEQILVSEWRGIINYAVRRRVEICVVRHLNTLFNNGMPVIYRSMGIFMVS